MMRIVVGLVLGALGTSAWAQTPSGISVRSVQAVGRGCPQGSVSASITDDGSVFSLLMDSYQAEANGNRQLDRRNCHIQIELSVPDGWNYSVVGVDYRGFVSVDAGALATHQVVYSFDGRMPNNERPGFEDGNGYAFRATEFRGPTTDAYLIRNELDVRVAPRSPCARNGFQMLHLNTFLTARLMDPRATNTALITLESVDGKLESQNFRLSWRRCDPFMRPEPPSRPPERPVPPPRPPRTPPRWGR